MRGFRQHNVYIGIDAGADSIKAVEVEFALAGEPILIKAAAANKADGLKKAVEGMRLKGAKVVGITDCPTACIRQLTIPAMTDRELLEAIKWEIKDKLPFSLDEAVVDYEVEGETEDAGVKKLKVRVAASPAGSINEVIGLLKDAGIEPASIIMPPLAFEHLSRHLGIKKEESVAVIDIGGEVSHICILKAGVLKFHRRISFGGDGITKAMAGVLASEAGRVELSAAEAEKIKIEQGIPKEAGEILIDGKISATQLRSLMRPAVERLSNEIGRSFEYYREESAGEKVASVILFGGTSRLKGLAEFLQEDLGVSVSCGNPFERIEIGKGKEAGGSVAQTSHLFGLALGAALSQGKGINLLPRELREKTRRTFERAWLEGCIAAVVAAALLTFLGMRMQLATYDKKISYGKLELKAMLPQAQSASGYDNVQDEIYQRDALINGILNETPLWKDIFKELSSIAPKEIVFAEMDMENDTLVIKGEILGAVEAREAALSDFIAALEGKIFKDVSLISAKVGEEGKAKSEFQIKCVYSTER